MEKNEVEKRETRVGTRRTMNKEHTEKRTNEIQTVTRPRVENREEKSDPGHSLV